MEDKQIKRQLNEATDKIAQLCDGESFGFFVVCFQPSDERPGVVLNSTQGNATPIIINQLLKPELERALKQSTQIERWKKKS